MAISKASGKALGDIEALQVPFLRLDWERASAPWKG